MIESLIAALGGELGLTSKEIADVVWLALQMNNVDRPATVSEPITEPRSPVLPSQPGSTEEFPDLPVENDDRPETPKQEPEAGLYPPGSEQSAGMAGALALQVPDARSLREPLALARALKPLLRQVMTGYSTVLDEAATVERIADEGVWLPVLKPSLEPWLELALVVDEGVSMQIWRRTIVELQRFMEHYGVFRDVRVWGLLTDEGGQVQIRPGIGRSAKRQGLRRPSALIDPSGRRLVLVVTDCVADLWRDGTVQPALKLWAASGPMAIVQMLPEWLWARTGLGFASAVRLQGLAAGVANQQLRVRNLSAWDEVDLATGIRVPVVTLESERLGAWAQMVAGKGGAWSAGVVLEAVGGGVSLPLAEDGEWDAAQRVQRFRVTASPMARRLAGLLAAAPVISLPVVRIIQERLLAESRQVHVAEVFLGGLLKPLVEITAQVNVDAVQYEFLDGVRDVLLESVRTSETVNVLNEVSQFVAERLGLSIDSFIAVLRNPQQIENQELAGNIRPFALITSQVLRQLGSEYSLLAERLAQFSVFEAKNLQEIVIPNWTELIQPQKRGLMDREMAELIQPFGEGDCESEVKLLKDKYRQYFFYSTRFSDLVLDPKCFLIVGRRGAGKTALSQFFSFQKRFSNPIVINVDEPTAFEQVLQKMPSLASQPREVAVPRITKIWELVMWCIIFRELQNEDPRIKAACLFSSSNGKLSTFIRKVLNTVLNKVTQMDLDLMDVLDEVFTNHQVSAGQKAVLEVVKRKPVIIAINTLENLTISDPAMMYTIAALIQFGANFNREYARKGLHIKIFLMGEIFPYIKEEVVLDTLKFIRAPLHLHWKPKDLMRLIGWRLHSYLKAMNQVNPYAETIDWDDYNDVLEKVWYPYFGRTLHNHEGQQEASFPYILRHTQMRPRQLIVLCNAIAQQAMNEDTFPQFESRTIIEAIARTQNALAEDVFNSYSSVYPKLSRIVAALTGLPMIFQGNELDRRAPLTASEWPHGEYSPLAFRQLVAELGIVGRVRRRNAATEFIEADFEYSMESRLPLLVTDECVIHPMFYQKLNIIVEANLRVYPFPDLERFRAFIPTERLTDYTDAASVDLEQSL